MATEYVCTLCEETKGRDGYYKKQWKLAGKGVCKLCWDDTLGHGKKRTASSDESPEEVANKRQKLEAKVQEKKKKEQESKERHMKKHKDLYNATFGVGYEPPQKKLIHFKSDPLSNESLLGTYELVFYSSDDERSEDIHRTAKGVLQLSMNAWSELNNEPAIFGRYAVDTRPTIHVEGSTYFENEWGEDTRGELIELGKSWSVPDCWDGFDVVTLSSENRDSCDFISNKGRKGFVLSREGRYGGLNDFSASDDESSASCEDHRWWNALPKDTEDVDYLMDLNHEYCGAVIKIVAKRHALGLHPDRLHNNKYHPKGRRVYLPDDGENVKVANKLTAQYRDGSNSWMYSHLQVPPDVAFKIREFVTPPPVFFMEENDLMLVVQESNAPEWEKILIFRKVEE